MEGLGRATRTEMTPFPPRGLVDINPPSLTLDGFFVLYEVIFLLSTVCRHA